MTNDDRPVLDPIEITADMAALGISEIEVRKYARWIHAWADPMANGAALAAELEISDPDCLWSPAPLANRIARDLAEKATLATSARR